MVKIRVETLSILHGPSERPQQQLVKHLQKIQNLIQEHVIKSHKLTITIAKQTPLAFSKRFHKIEEREEVEKIEEISINKSRERLEFVGYRCDL